MSPRRAGSLTLGLLVGASGAATLLRAGYAALPAWRRGVAWGAIAVGLLLLAAALRRDPV